MRISLHENELPKSVRSRQLAGPLCIDGGGDHFLNEGFWDAVCKDVVHLFLAQITENHRIAWLSPHYPVFFDSPQELKLHGWWIGDRIRVV